MDVYTLNDGFGREEIIEKFESLIWTERYSQFGDFELSVSDTAGMRELLQEGTLLSTPESRSVMILDTPDIEDGKIKVSGQDLKGFLQNRILWALAITGTWKKYWEITGAPGWIAGEIVRQMCMPGGYLDGTALIPTADDELFPNLIIGPTEVGDPVTIGVEYGNVYGGVKAVCDVYNLGFDLYPDNITDSDYDLIFTTWAGLDRTSTQDVNDVVIFEPALDSLANTKELRSIAGYKNVAYAWAPSIDPPSYTVGTATTTDGATATGFNRRTLMVAADDISTVPTGTTLEAILVQRAKDALANNNYVRMVDGEIVPQKEFLYGLNYNLGDIIELRSDSGAADKARITEYIRTQDASGERAYPTLSVIT